MSPLISGLASVASMIFNASSSNAGKAPAARRPADTAEAGPASVVHLSPQAQALAGAAGKALTQSAQAVATAATGAGVGGCCWLMYLSIVLGCKSIASESAPT